MGPYRSSGSESHVKQAQASDRLHFPRACFRLGRDRFEASFAGVTSEDIVLALALALPPLAPLFLLLWLIGRLQSTTLVVTRNGAWVERRTLGIGTRRCSLGLRPHVEDCGYDWNEIAVVPVEPSLRAGLEGEREVLVEWEWNDPAKDEEARRLMAFMNAEIDRLLGPHS